MWGLGVDPIYMQGNVAIDILMCVSVGNLYYCELSLCFGHCCMCVRLYNYNAFKRRKKTLVRDGRLLYVHRYTVVMMRMIVMMRLM